MAMDPRGITDNVLSNEQKIAVAKVEVLRVFKEAANEPGIDGMDAAMINTVAPVVARAVEQVLKKVL